MPTIKLFANLRAIAGLRETTITGAYLGEVITNLVCQHPELGEYLLEDGKVRSELIITINGHPTKNTSAPVMEHDQIAIFPPISGGCYGCTKENL